MWIKFNLCKFSLNNLKGKLKDKSIYYNRFPNKQSETLRPRRVKGKYG